MAPAFSTPPAEIERRCRCIQKSLRQHGIGAIFIAQRVDLYYFSGTAQNGLLYLPAEGAPLLFIRRHYPRARQESPIEHILSIDSVKAIPERIQDILGSLPEVIGFELDVMPVREFRFYQSLL